MIETEYKASNRLRLYQLIALVVGIVGVILLAIGFVIDAEQLRHSFLFGYMYWTGIAIGGLVLTMVPHVSGGVWGATIRRVTEAAAITIPLMGLLYLLVIATGLQDVYLWSRPEAVEGNHILEEKELFLNVPSFLVRVFLYFLIWSVLAFLLNRWSDRLDASGHWGWRSRLTRLSAGGILIFAVTITLASVDLVMSLEPEWFSTIFGVLIAMTMVLTSFAFTIIVISLLTMRGPLRDVLSAEHFHDLGKWLHAFVILWTYFSLAQFLIIWVGNAPLEAVYYINRLRGGWQWMALAIVLLLFALPFLLLLSRGLKRNPRTLSLVAGVVLVMQAVNWYWYVVPAFRPRELTINWMDVVALIAIGGIWIAAFLWWLASRPLLPLHVLPIRHPRMRRGLEHVGH